MSIIGIAFDGMHRSGKGSQISLLKNTLDKNQLHNIKVRGEYYRHGSGDHILEDPYSKRRQKNIFNTNYHEKSNRINRELAILYKRKYPAFLQKNNIKDGVVIQDRSIIGNYLFLSGEGKNISDDITSYYIDKNQLIKKEVIIPQLIFILQPPQEVLLQRLYEGFDKNEINATGRLLYKEKYISEKYQEYYNGYNILPDKIKKNVIVITGAKSKEETHNIIIEKVCEKINIIFGAGV